MAIEMPRNQVPQGHVRRELAQGDLMAARQRDGVDILTARDSQWRFVAEPEVTFDPADHSYRIDGRRVPSVTALVKSVVPPFDRDRVAANTARKRGESAAAVLAEWDAKAAAGLEKGTRVHAYIEDVMAGTADPVLAAVNEKLPEMAAFDAAWASIREKLGAAVAGREQVVASPSLGVAGRVDALLRLQLPGGKSARCVFDWKTGKFSDRNPFENLLPPWSDLPNSELHVYSLQTSLYRLILEEGGQAYDHCYLVHLSERGTYHVYRSLDFRDRLRAWVPDAARKLSEGN